MAPPATVLALSAGVVALVCAIIAFAAWRVLLRTGNRAIAFVVAAFAVLSAKNLAKAATLGAFGDEGAWAELAFSLADLAAVLLVAWPLVLRRRPA